MTATTRKPTPKHCETENCGSWVARRSASRRWCVSCLSKHPEDDKYATVGGRVARGAEEPAETITPDVPAIDPKTGLPWGVDIGGFDHRLPHHDNEDCPLGLCNYCSSTHCEWFCETMHQAHAGVGS